MCAKPIVLHVSFLTTSTPCLIQHDLPFTVQLKTTEIMISG